MDSRFNHLLIYTDGSMTPVGVGAGVAILDLSGKLVHLENRILERMTNNEAEYAALALGLELALHLDAEIVDIRSDSEVMVYQMRGEFAVKNHRLKQKHWQVCQLATQFLRVRYTHIARERNGLADALAAEASAGRQWSIGYHERAG